MRVPLPPLPPNTRRGPNVSSRLLFVARDVGFQWRSPELPQKEPNVGKSLLSLSLMFWWVMQLVVHI
jgi:hypothetical protein